MHAISRPTSSPTMHDMLPARRPYVGADLRYLALNQTPSTNTARHTDVQKNTCSGHECIVYVTWHSVSHDVFVYFPSFRWVLIVKTTKNCRQMHTQQLQQALVNTINQSPVHRLYKVYSELSHSKIARKAPKKNRSVEYCTYLLLVDAGSTSFPL